MERRSCDKSLDAMKGATRALARLLALLAINDAGWDIPGASGATVQDRTLTGQSGEIVMETLRPLSPAGSIMIVSCFPQESGRILIRDQAINGAEAAQVQYPGTHIRIWHQRRGCRRPRGDTRSSSLRRNPYVLRPRRFRPFQTARICE
jgi:hypothetical protein